MNAHFLHECSPPFSQTKQPTNWSLSLFLISIRIDNKKTSCTCLANSRFTCVAEVAAVTKCLVFSSIKSGVQLFRKFNVCYIFHREICRFQKTKREVPTGVECLLVLDKAEIPLELDDHSIRVVSVSSIVMKKLSGVQSTECIEAIALMRIPSTFHSVDDNFKEDVCSWFPSSHRVLVLDGIQVIPPTSTCYSLSPTLIFI